MLPVTIMSVTLKASLNHDIGTYRNSKHSDHYQGGKDWFVITVSTSLLRIKFPLTQAAGKIEDVMFNQNPDKWVDLSTLSVHFPGVV